MKKAIAVALASFFFISISAHAQTLGLGIKGGANLTKISGKSFNDGFDLGYQLGAFAEIDFSKTFGIQPEVLFSQSKTTRTNNFSTIYSNVFDPASNKDIQLNYLSIPILLRYNVSQVLTINAGPQFSILIDDNENLLTNGKNAFKNNDMAVVGGVTFNFSKLRIYGRYSIGLSNLNDMMTGIIGKASKYRQDWA